MNVGYVRTCEKVLHKSPNGELQNITEKNIIKVKYIPILQNVSNSTIVRKRISKSESCTRQNSSKTLKKVLSMNQIETKFL